MLEGKLDERNCTEDGEPTAEACLKCGEECCICPKLSHRIQRRLRSIIDLKERQKFEG